MDGVEWRKYSKKKYPSSSRKCLHKGLGPHGTLAYGHVWYETYMVCLSCEFAFSKLLLVHLYVSCCINERAKRASVVRTIF